jgi:hypothetical protein
MTYNDDLTWELLVKHLSYNGKVALIRLHEWIEAYYEWESFVNGRTLVDVANALKRDEAEVIDMDNAYKALKALYDFGNNGVPIQRDYMADLRKFS